MSIMFFGERCGTVKVNGGNYLESLVRLASLETEEPKMGYYVSEHSCRSPYH
ncbi:MAG: hypothetical protein ACE5L7_09420 [Candidatus Aminicenantales bacterium]